jgi:hypothetical protein
MTTTPRSLTMRTMALSLCLCLSPGWALSASASDELKKCFAQSSTSKDNVTLLKWAAKAMVAHPALTEIPAMKATDKTTIDREFAAYVEKILITDCKRQTIDTFQTEGLTALQGALETLSQQLIKELMSNPEVNKEISAFASHIDQNKLMGALLGLK